MTDEHRKVYEGQDIRLHFLVKTDHSGYEEKVSAYRGDGSYHTCDSSPLPFSLPACSPSGYMDARRLVQGKDYKDACLKMCEEAVAMTKAESGRRILVLGTEECMYPALCLAYGLEKAGNHVRCHATTRSPITVSGEGAYSLHERYELISLYDDDRRTFIYNLAAYEDVFIVTDAKAGEKGVSSLVHALSSCGNNKIQLIRWCYK